MERSGNPVLTAKTFSGFVKADETMSIGGTVNKTAFLLVALVLSAGYVWHQFFAYGDPSVVAPFVWVGCIGGLVVGLVTVFGKQWAPVTAPIYAVLEGFVIGGLSALLESQYPGIVIQAVGLTFGTLLSLLIAYKTRLIRVSENFKLGVTAATGGIVIVYFFSFLLRMFGVAIPFVHSSGPWGILFSLFVVVIAALNLVLDFDFIEKGAQQGAPKFMEWYAAFGLLVTLIWLYLEILRLLAKARSRR